jgi:hypothetical protein
MKRRAGVLLVCGLFVASAWPDAAQAQPPRLQLFAAYSFVHDRELNDGLPTGFAVGAGGRITDWFAVVGEVGGSTRAFGLSDEDDLRLTLYSFLMGPQFARRGHRVLTPFLQILVGGVRAGGSFYGDQDASTLFAVQPGGGVDVAITPRIGVRLLGDFRVINADLSTLREGARSQQIRWLIGAVFTLGP